MCNAYGTLHGGCAAYLVDTYVQIGRLIDSESENRRYLPIRCSFSALAILGLLLGIDGTGFTQSMDIIWLCPIYA
jgi:acyl-coenzyme A thioesterase 13